MRTEHLAAIAIQSAAMAARAYLNNHDLSADPDALCECIKSHVKISLPVALADAQQALDVGMKDAAAATFIASMRLAGIEAAKEAGFPIGMIIE